jgi:hypothetical protein
LRERVHRRAVDDREREHGGQDHEREAEVRRQDERQ